MPRVSEEYARNRRRQILDAAAVSFARKGLHAATMDDVCAEAKLSKGAVYGYFRSKDDIISALKVESVQRDGAALKTAMQQGDPEQAFAAMLEWVAGGVALDDRRLTDVQTWAQALLDVRLHDTQSLETQLWVDALDLLAQESQSRNDAGTTTSTRDVAKLLACVIYGAMAMKSWDPGFDVAGVARASGRLLTRES